MTALRRKLLVALMLVAAVSVIASPVASSTRPAGGQPTLAQLIGQKLMITMSGAAPSAALLGRVRRGEIGGVVLLGANVESPSQLTDLTRRLQQAAAAGGQPRLLIAVDQEGGSIKRVPWAPPTKTVPEMGRTGSKSVAQNQGARTGAALAGLGINVDLAPVADVPRSTRSFIYQQGRAFSFDATVTTRLADAFATGLGNEGVASAMKHFPGLGLAEQNTDDVAVTIRASRATLATDLRPYRRAIGNDIPMIMLSNATYTAYDPNNAAGWSAAIGTALLRHDLGFRGVTITDALDGAAQSRGTTQRKLALRVAKAGTDLLLIKAAESTSATIYESLLSEARDGQVSRQTLEASYNRILALKHDLQP
ncbi:MAG: beta-N-acetylhexosaminidase [Chloroflexota bacterium]|jgi:beta-N-acetylhexosaminidase|nr:beta-N-acetylhexosaminidase [Chloroflexota bacterium]